MKPPTAAQARDANPGATISKPAAPRVSPGAARSKPPQAGQSHEPGPPAGNGASDDTGEERNPNNWFKLKFPELAERHGEPVAVTKPRSGGMATVQDLNETFIAATLSEAASPDTPSVYLLGENKFYTYTPEQGIYTLASEEDISVRLSNLLLTCAQDCKEKADVSKLEFALRDSAALSGAIKRARSLLRVRDDFFSGGMEKLLPLANGVLRIEDRTLLPFAPSYSFRNKLAVDYVAEARCPIFEGTLLLPSLSREDIGLLQLWSGLALVGRNIAQRMLILSGTAGAGKGTFIRILKGIIGEANIGSLRTDKLADRFEIGRLIDRTLLYGADVPANFLSGDTASILKSLTGGDPMTVEIKGSMAAPSLTCAFNIVVTSNSRLTVHLEGDVPAWQRRLAIISYDRDKPANTIPDLDKKILEKEAPGVLNWMLDGLYALRYSNWQLPLTSNQKQRVDDLLLESDSVNVFFRDRCIGDTTAEGITASEAFTAYSDFCMDRGWNPVDRYRFGRDCQEIVQRTFRLSTRHDIKGQTDKKQRGWKGLRLLRDGESTPE